ncbi:MAG: MFS transporter [Dehalococcoidia bacterium]|nr:MFS transporter [Dehalococcoidia bacterium]
MRTAFRFFEAWPEIVRRSLPLLAIGFLSDAAFIFVFLIALQSYLPETLHASPALAGYALAAFGVAKLVSQVASGVVSDRLGTRRAMIGGTALLLIADSTMLPLAHLAPYAIIGSAAVEGLGSSVLWPAIYSAGNSRFDAGARSRFTALLTVATMAALLAGLGGGTVLNLYAGFNTAMALPIGSVAAAFAIALLTPVSAGEALERETGARPSLRELPTILRSPQRLAFSAIVLAESVALGAVAASFRAYGREIAGVSLAREGLLLAPAAVLGGASVIVGGALADRVGARRVMVPGFAAAGIAVMLLSHFAAPWFVVVAAAVGGVGFGLAVPTIASTMLALSGGAGGRGGVIGWFMSMDGLGHAIGPGLAAVLLGVSGAGPAMLLVGAAFLTVSAVAATRALTADERTRTGDDARRMAAAPAPVLHAERGRR